MGVEECHWLLQDETVADICALSSGSSAKEKIDEAWFPQIATAINYSLTSPCLSDMLLVSLSL